MDFKKTYRTFLVPHDVLEDIKFKKLTPNAKILYVTLCKHQNRYADDDGWFFRSMLNLVEDTGMHLNTLKKAKKLLIKNHFIDKKSGFYIHGGKRSYDFYRLNGFRFKQGDGVQS